MFRKFREEFECPHFPKLPLLRCPNFLRFFLPFRSVGFCLRALGPSGRGSRGTTPLHHAAANGKVSAVARLIEARAAVDVQDNTGRGLGTKDLGRKTFLRQWDLYVKKWMKCWFDSKFWLFMESVSQNMCTTILLWSLWSRYFTIVSCVHLELSFLWSGFRVGLCSWVWGVSTTLMWHLPFCRSHNLNVSFSISIASSAIFGLDTRNKKNTIFVVFHLQAIYFYFHW